MAPSFWHTEAYHPIQSCSWCLVLTIYSCSFWMESISRVLVCWISGISSAFHIGWSIQTSADQVSLYWWRFSIATDPFLIDSYFSESGLRPYMLWWYAWLCLRFGLLWLGDSLFAFSPSDIDDDFLLGPIVNFYVH
jgi:hypothetical protein